ncbi:hypothetical protein CQ012_16410 [Arthrobacter sp. MYb214]|nr:hypothetical protein CQ012_16410 [Arthrobacter sp. MYb214]
MLRFGNLGGFLFGDGVRESFFLLLRFALFNRLANLGLFLLLQGSEVADQVIAQLLLRCDSCFVGGQGAVRGRCGCVIVGCSFFGGVLCRISIFLPSRNEAFGLGGGVDGLDLLFAQRVDGSGLVEQVAFLVVIKEQAQGRGACAIAVDIRSDSTQIVAALLQVSLCVLELFYSLLGRSGAQIALFAGGEQGFLSLSGLSFNALQFGAAGSQGSFDARDHRVRRSLILLCVLDLCVRR